jgi:hypothetical protein
VKHTRTATATNIVMLGTSAGLWMNAAITMIPLMVNVPTSTAPHG